MLLQLAGSIQTAENEPVRGGELAGIEAGTDVEEGLVDQGIHLRKNMDRAGMPGPERQLTR